MPTAEGEDVSPVVFDDVYLQPDAPDPLLEGHVIVEAARRHAGAAGRVLAVDESGGEARAYLLEGGVVVKTQRPHRLRPRTSLEKEALFLRELERGGDFPVPRVLGHGEVQEIEYLCLTRIPGSTLEQLDLAGDLHTAVLVELGRTLRAIHELDQSALRTSGLVPGDSTGHDLEPRIAETFDRLTGAFDRERRLREIVDIRRIASARMACIPETIQPVALHSNPGPEHTFVDPVTGKFSGLIDFGDAYYSHPAFDFRPWSAPGDAAAVLAGYRSAGPLSNGFEDVLRTVLVIGELGRAARGRRAPGDLAASLSRLLD